MNALKVKTTPEFEEAFTKFPAPFQKKLLKLRKIIRESAEEVPSITTLEESLKWGEPSFLTPKGSTIRIDWKAKKPSQYALYFKCTSLLVPTFKQLFKKRFTFEGNRAIIFHLDDEIPREALKKCIKTALTYHKIKHLPQLGISLS